MTDNPCIHCGFCLPACPTYAVLGTEMDSPRGRLALMEALDSGRIEPSRQVLEHLDLCLGCRACESACPSGVPYGERLVAARQQYHDHRNRPLSRRLLEGLVLRAVALPPWIQEAGAAALRLAARAKAGALLSHVGGHLGLAASLLPAAPRPAPLMPTHFPAERRRARGRVALLQGCVGRTLFGELNLATGRLLARAGYEVLVPAGQRCCGALHVHAGDLAGATALARTNLAALSTLGDIDAVVISAAGCGSALAEMGHWIQAGQPGDQPDDQQGDVRLGDQARRYAALVRDPTELLAEAGLPPARRSVSARVAYHDACHLAHARGVRDAPRALLEAVPGVELVPLLDADRCCGSAGIYNLLHPAPAEAVLAAKLARLAASGADTLTAANPGCLLQIDAGLRRAGSALRVCHPLELVAEAQL